MSHNCTLQRFISSPYYTLFTMSSTIPLHRQIKQSIHFTLSFVNSNTDCSNNNNNNNNENNNQLYSKTDGTNITEWNSQH
ncbi:unnamed protein product [Trichobilharzia regenti]|nr:unnamed protein product [Trichobilharzia regenti]